MSPHFPFLRLPRYNLILKDLIQNTHEGHKDLKNLCESLQKVSAITAYCNESQRRKLNIKKMMEVTKHISENLGKGKKTESLFDQVRNITF